MSPSVPEFDRDDIVLPLQFPAITRNKRPYDLLDCLDFVFTSKSRPVLED